MNLNLTESNRGLKLNYRDLAIFIVPILIFSLYVYIYNPGVLTASSYSQLHQIVSGQFTNAHPIFHTLFEMACLKIFKSPISIGIIQMIIFSVLWMIICNYHRDDSADSSNEFFIQFIITLIICLIPINAVYSITLSSNILFSYSVMFLCFLIKVMIDAKGQIDKKLIIIMAITLAIMSGLSTYGIYIALFSLMTILYYLFDKNPPENTYIILVGIALIGMLLIGSLNFIYDVDNDTSNIKTNDAFKEGINLENAKNQFFSSISNNPSDEIENTAPINIKNSNYNLVDSFVNMFRENFILDGLFNNPLLCMIFSIILLVLISTTIKSEEIFLMYAPALLNLVLVVLTGQNNLYSTILIFYMIIIIFISLYFKVGFDPSNISNITQIISKPKEIKTYETPQLNYKEKTKTDKTDKLNNVEKNYGVQNTYSPLESVNEKIKEEYNSEDYYNKFEELEDLTLEDIDTILNESKDKETQQKEKSNSDLINQILKEMEIEKENK